MKDKLNKMWTKVQYFCATQGMNFYVGMLLELLALVNLPLYVSPVLSLPLSVCCAVIVYLVMRILTGNEGKMVKWKDIRKNLLAAFLGSLWVMLFAL